MATTVGSEFKSSGITENTPKNILLGAGTIHSGLQYTSNAWNFEESLIGATSGGSKLSIVPEFYDVPVDGATVKVKGLTVKVGETATLEINSVELNENLLKLALVASSAAATESGYTELTSKRLIETGDYISNLAFVGKKMNGEPIIVILKNALCTSGLELESKNKEAAIPKLVFECYADLSSEADTLPWRILYPTQTTD